MPVGVRSAVPGMGDDRTRGHSGREQSACVPWAVMPSKWTQYQHGVGSLSYGWKDMQANVAGGWLRGRAAPAGRPIRLGASISHTSPGHPESQRGQRLLIANPLI